VSGAAIVARLSPNEFLVAASRPDQGNYHVFVTDERAYCSCPAGVFRGACKHIAAVRSRYDEPEEGHAMPNRQLIPVTPQTALTTAPSAAMTDWSEERKALVKRTVAKGATDDELLLFAEVCKRTGLDPFAHPRQIHAVKRWSKADQREVMAIQISIDGLRLLAERTRHYAGQVGPWWCGADGEWRDIWLAKEPPAAARVGVLRRDWQAPLYAVARWESFAQTGRDGKTTPMWASMPEHMLAKCAESQALRRAFPAELAGFELAVGDEDDPPAPTRGTLASPNPRPIDGAYGRGPTILEAVCALCGVEGLVLEAGEVYDAAAGRVCADRTACRRRVAERRRPATARASDGLLTADELAPGGVHRGEQGGILEAERGADPDDEPSVGEVVGLAECAHCGTVAECLFDGAAYICADSGACARRCTAEGQAREQQMALEAIPPPEAPEDPSGVTAKQLESIHAHLDRTRKTEAEIVEELGHPLERLSREDASQMLRTLGKLPNKPAPAGDEAPAL
jgi:phage recombination protein Bet